MSTRKYYTEDEKTELLANPFTFRVTDTMVQFNLAFKKFFIHETQENGLSYRKVFLKAGYRKELLSDRQVLYHAGKIKEEAASEEGLREPKLPKRRPVKKKHKATELNDIKKRVLLLEQQIEFLKKSQFLKKHGQMPPDSTD